MINLLDLTTQQQQGAFEKNDAQAYAKYKPTA